MTVDAHHIISVSLRKIQGSRSRRGGPDLCKNLLVSNVLHKAKRVFIQKHKTSTDDEDDDDDGDEGAEDDEDETEEDVVDEESRNYVAVDFEEEERDRNAAGNLDEDEDDVDENSFNRVDEDDGNLESELSEEDDDDPNRSPSQVPPQNRLFRLLPPALDEDNLIFLGTNGGDSGGGGGGVVVRNLQKDYLTSTDELLTAVEDEASSSSSGSGESIEDEGDGRGDFGRHPPTHEHHNPFLQHHHHQTVSVIDPASVLVSVYNDPSLHPGIDNSQNDINGSADFFSASSGYASSSSCQLHHPQPCHCLDLTHQQHRASTLHHGQQLHSAVAVDETLDQRHLVIQSAAQSPADATSSPWAAPSSSSSSVVMMKRRRSSSSSSDDDVFEVSEDDVTDFQSSTGRREKRMRLDSTYECGYYSEITAPTNSDYRVADPVSGATGCHNGGTIVATTSDSTSASYSTSQQTFSQHSGDAVSDSSSTLHLMSSMAIPSTPSALPVDTFQQQPYHHHHSVVPSVHSIAGKMLDSGEAPPRNMASMLTPLKCVAPTPLTTTMTPTSNGAAFADGGKIAPPCVTASEEGKKSYGLQRDNGTQITSLVSRFSTGFSGLTSSKQQQLQKPDGAPAEIAEVVASLGQQPQQSSNGASVSVNDISSVSICSALIKESFDVLSRPSLLTMSV